jgi:hypothetical protein
MLPGYAPVPAVVPPPPGPGCAWRVLVTGSREWKDGAAVAAVLTGVAIACYQAGYAELVIVHGDCLRGADALAKAWIRWAQALPGRRLKITEDPHEAQWLSPCRASCREGCRVLRRDGRWCCRAAGNYRNAEMTDLGADACEAFLADGARNRGTRDCMKRAKDARIPVRSHRGGVNRTLVSH